MNRVSIKKNSRARKEVNALCIDEGKVATALLPAASWLSLSGDDALKNYQGNIRPGLLLTTPHQFSVFSRRSTVFPSVRGSSVPRARCTVWEDYP